MYVFNDGCLYRLVRGSWQELWPSLKRPEVVGQATMQAVGNYLYLFANGAEGAAMHRLNLRKLRPVVLGAPTTDYSVELT